MAAVGSGRGTCLGAGLTQAESPFVSAKEEARETSFPILQAQRAQLWEAPASRCLGCTRGQNCPKAGPGRQFVLRCLRELVIRAWHRSAF